MGGGSALECDIGGAILDDLCDNGGRSSGGVPVPGPTN